MDRWSNLQRVLRWLLVAALLNAIGWLSWWAIPRLSNSPPVSKLILVSVNETNRTVVVSDGGSYDPDARSGRKETKITQWKIAWGDGQEDVFTNRPSSELHQYDADGSYQIRLACADTFGAFGDTAAINVEIRFVTKIVQAAQALERKAEQDRIAAQTLERKAEQDQQSAHDAGKVALAAGQMADQTKNALPKAKDAARSAVEAQLKVEQEAKSTLADAEELGRIAILAESKAGSDQQDADKKQQKALHPPFLASRSKLKQEADQAANNAKASNEKAKQARSAADKAQQAAQSKQQEADTARLKAAESERSAKDAELAAERAKSDFKQAQDSAAAAQRNAETAHAQAQQAMKQAEDSQKSAQLAKQDAQTAADTARQRVSKNAAGTLLPRTIAPTKE